MITVSNNTRDDLVQIGFDPSNVTVIRNGIDLSVHKPTSKKSDFPHVLSVGRLWPQKGIHFIIQAFAIVRARLPNARMSIVGTGSPHYERALREMVTRLELTDAVSFLGKLSEEAKTRYMGEAHVLVLQSVREGWGLVVTEANACGTPVIASNVPGLRESVIDGQTGMLVSRGNINEIADKIILLLENHQLREQMCREAIRHSKKFDIEISSATMLEFLEAVRSNFGSR
jgi:glycosyltransferase involved in cell wall biosynthesis